MQQTRPLAAVSDDELLRRLAELLAQNRRVECDLVAHIAEVDERRLYARYAAPSMFAYCTEVLHLSEAEAYLRITAARASREHPVLLTMLADGRLHLSGIAKLAPLLTPETRDALLGRASHRSKRQIEELIAEIAPRPDAPALMRKLPERRALLSPVLPLRRDGVVHSRPGAAAGSEARSAPAGGEVLGLGPDGVASRRPAAPTDGKAAVSSSVGGDGWKLGPDGVPAAAAAAASGAPRVAAPGSPQVAPPSATDSLPAASPAVIIQPLAPSRYKVQFTASAELHAKLQRLQELLRSQAQDGDLAAIIELAVSEKLERLEARRFGSTSRPRKDLTQSDPSPSSRYIPAAVRRAVRERDGGRCCYLDEAGRRCSERGRLEYHHRHPFGLGGDHNLKNLRLMCHAHNSYLAEHDYGREAMARDRRSSNGGSGAIANTSLGCPLSSASASPRGT
jgi:5-methylcytosine-specific restriction endonuclease McrA